MEKGLEEKTGKTLDAWVKIVRKENFAKHGQIISFLKSEHSFTHGYANLVAHKARESDAGSFDADELVTSQYKGKENLFPIYEKLMTAIKALGDDVEVAPKRAAVSLKTKKQFALIQPSTKTRIDLGLKIKDRLPEGRLESSGPFGSMCTHRIQITDVSDVDAEVINYLITAYQGSK